MIGQNPLVSPDQVGGCADTGGHGREELRPRGGYAHPVVGAGEPGLGGVYQPGGEVPDVHHLHQFVRGSGRQYRPVRAGQPDRPVGEPVAPILGPHDQASPADERGYAGVAYRLLAGDLAASVRLGAVVRVVQLGRRGGQGRRGLRPLARSGLVGVGGAAGHEGPVAGTPTELGERRPYLARYPGHVDHRVEPLVAQRGEPVRYRAVDPDQGRAVRYRPRGAPRGAGDLMPRRQRVCRGGATEEDRTAQDQQPHQPILPGVPPRNLSADRVTQLPPPFALDTAMPTSHPTNSPYADPSAAAWKAPSHEALDAMNAVKKAASAEPKISAAQPRMKAPPPPESDLDEIPSTAATKATSSSARRSCASRSRTCDVDSSCSPTAQAGQASFRRNQPHTVSGLACLPTHSVKAWFPNNSTRISVVMTPAPVAVRARPRIAMREAYG